MTKRDLVTRAGSAQPLKKKSFVRRLFSGFTLRSTDVWHYVSGGGPGGITSVEQAIQLSAVWRAVRLNSETIASLPIHAYRWTDNGPQRVDDSPTLELIAESPNAEQTPMEFWEGMQASIELCGDAIAVKDRIGDRVPAIRMVNAQTCNVRRLNSGDLVYEVHLENGERRDYSAADVFHVRGFAINGVRGISTVSAGAASLGLARNAEQSAQNVFINGLRLSGFLKSNQVLKQDDRARLQQILDTYMGKGNAGGMMVLEAGMEFQKMGINPVDAELLTTRKFEIEEIGRWFGVPPILLGHAVEGQTMWGSGVTSIIESWLTLGLRQRLIRNQQAIAKRLRTPEERRQRVYFRYNPDALLAMLSTQRVDVLTKSVAGSLMTVNESRQKQGLPPVPGGDDILAPVNLAPLGSLGENGNGEARVRAILRDWLMPDQSEVRDA